MMLNIFMCFVFVQQSGMQDLNSWPGIQPMPPAVEAQSLNYRITARELLIYNISVVQDE